MNFENKQRRILLFSPKGSGEHYYGPGMNAFKMYKTLTENSGYQISLAHGYKEQKKYSVFKHQYFISDIVNKKPLLGLKFMYRANKWINKNYQKFDLVHCLTSFHHSFMFALWFEKKGIPAVIKIGQSDHTGFNSNSLQSKLAGLNRYRVKHANQISGFISLSPEIRSKLEFAGIQSDRIHDIPNGVETSVFKSVEKKKKSELRASLQLKDVFTVLFTGAFSERKNPLLIAKAFSKYKLNENIQLLLIGPDTDGGIQRKEIKNLIKQEQIKNIFVKDHVNDIVKYYQISDLFVLPSSQEGFSNSMLEAQACGLPALVTKISGAVELIQEGINGKFIERDTESLYCGIDLYFQDNQRVRKEAINAQNIVNEKYSMEKILLKYLDVFDTKISNTHSLNGI